MNVVDILVGTTTGTSLKVAQTICSRLMETGFSVAIHQNYTLEQYSSDYKNYLIICSSNTGMGDIPRNISEFFNELSSLGIPTKKRYYSIVNLGDSTFPCFGKAGYTIDSIMRKVGGLNITEIFTLDANSTSDYDVTASKWTADWIQKIKCSGTYVIPAF